MDGAYRPVMREPQTNGRLPSGMPNPPPWNGFLEQGLPSSSNVPRQYQPYADRLPRTFTTQQDPQTRRVGYFGPVESTTEFDFQNPKYGLPRIESSAPFAPRGNADTWNIQEPLADPNHQYAKFIQECRDEIRAEIRAGLISMRTEMKETRNDIQELKSDIQTIRRLAAKDSNTINTVINKATEYMMFLSGWVKDFGQKVDPLMSKLALDVQQHASREAQPVSLGRDLEDESGFGAFFNT